MGAALVSRPFSTPKKHFVVPNGSKTSSLRYLTTLSRDMESARSPRGAAR